MPGTAAALDGRRTAAGRRKVLCDLPRKGGRATFTTEQQAAVVAIACEDPDAESQRPISRWTRQEIADEAVRRGVAPSISAGTVGDCLKSRGPQAAPQQVLALPKTGRSGRLERRRAFGLPSVS